jgi:hypothetical protein
MHLSLLKIVEFPLEATRKSPLPTGHGPVALRGIRHFSLHDAAAA